MKECILLVLVPYRLLDRLKYLFLSTTEYFLRFRNVLLMYSQKLATFQVTVIITYEKFYKN